MRVLGGYSLEYMSPKGGWTLVAGDLTSSDAQAQMREMRKINSEAPLRVLDPRRHVVVLNDPTGEVDFTWGSKWANNDPWYKSRV